MYSQERELKKLRVTIHNKARVEGCIVEAFTCKEITNFSSKYFSRVNNVNTHTTWYHIVEEVPLSKLSIFQWKGKGVGAPSAHYVIDNEWNYIMIYMYTNMEEAIGFHTSAWGQKWSKLPEVVPPTCNFSLRPFFISNCHSSITHI
jgi:hypothetical protein